MAPRKKAAPKPPAAPDAREELLWVNQSLRDLGARPLLSDGAVKAIPDEDVRQMLRYSLTHYKRLLGMMGEQEK